MNIFFIGIGSLLILAIIAAIATKLTKKKEGEPDVVMPTSGDCSSCDGTDDKCEQVCMMEAAVKGVEYYDDEELDVFRGGRLTNIPTRKLRSLQRFFIRCNPMR